MPFSGDSLIISQQIVFCRPWLHDTGSLFASDSFRQNCDAHCSYRTPDFQEPTLNCSYTTQCRPALRCLNLLSLAAAKPNLSGTYRIGAVTPDGMLSGVNWIDFHLSSKAEWLHPAKK